MYVFCDFTIIYNFLHYVLRILHALVDPSQIIQLFPFIDNSVVCTFTKCYEVFAVLSYFTVCWKFPWHAVSVIVLMGHISRDVLYLLNDCIKCTLFSPWGILTIGNCMLIVVYWLSSEKTLLIFQAIPSRWHLQFYYAQMSFLLCPLPMP